jgi:hypothetical protein
MSSKLVPLLRNEKIDIEINLLSPSKLHIFGLAFLRDSAFTFSTGGGANLSGISSSNCFSGFTFSTLFQAGPIYGDMFSKLILEIGSISLSLAKDRTFIVEHSPENGNVLPFLSQPYLVSGKEIHLAISYHPDGTLKLYINGVPKVISKLSEKPLQEKEKFVFGSENEDYEWPWVGWLRKSTFIQRSLSGNEIKNLSEQLERFD